jgi:iron complex transport system substrate-binding protein
VALNPAALELIRLMGEIHRVVGVTNSLKARSALIPEAKFLPSVGKGSMPNLEALAALNPDLVIAWSGYPGPELEERLGALGACVLRLDFYYPSLLEKETKVLANILSGDARRRAEDFLAWNKNLNDCLNEKIEKLGRQKKPTVLAEFFENRNLAGKDSGVYWTTVLAGGDNLGANFKGKSADADPEWVVKADPDFYIKLVEFASSDGILKPPSITEGLIRDIVARPGWDEMRAVKNQNVFALDSDLSGGPRDMVGVYAIAHRFYPELIPASDAARINSEYFKIFHDLVR